MSEKQTAVEWKLIGHSYPIADSGDYDGHYEITNGKISLLTDDDDDESLQPIVDVLNACAEMEDPAKEISDLRAQLDEAVKELEELKSKQPKIIMEVDGKTIATFFGQATLTKIKGGADER